MQGDIGVAKSTDKGATWQQLGIALNEDWHLSYPYVFDHLGQVYMMLENLFLYIQGDTFYLFYETKNSITIQGDIRVKISIHIYKSKVLM